MKLSLQYTREMIADEYGYSRELLRKEMKITGYEFPYTLTPKWCKLIYEEFGYPEKVDPADYARVKLPRAYRHLFPES